MQIVTDKVKPSPAIVSLVQKLYEEKIKDARFLIPIVNGLSRGDLIKLLPQFISLPGKGWTEVLMRLLGSDYGKSPISPAELLVALHQLDPARDNVPMKAIMVAITTCFGRRDVYVLLACGNRPPASSAVALLGRWVAGPQAATCHLIP